MRLASIKSPDLKVKIFPTRSDSIETLKELLVFTKIRPKANVNDVTIPMETSP